MYITSRSSARGEKTRNALVEKLSISPDKIQSLQLDFSDLKSVDAATAKLKEKEKRLDLLSTLQLLLPVWAGNTETADQSITPALRNPIRPVSAMVGSTT